MNTIDEITQIILTRSKFKDKHLARFSNEILLDKIAGNADINLPETRKAAEFVILLTNELRARCEFINADLSSKYWNDEQTFNYASVDNSTYGHTKIFSKFLNTYDLTGESFKPLLERLKSKPNEILATAIFEEIQKVHEAWCNIYRNADGYLNLRLNHVPTQEIESIKTLVECGLFERLTNDRFGFMTDIMKPACYEEDKIFHHDREFKSDDIYSLLSNKYSKSLDFNFHVSGDTYLISKDDRYFLIGNDEQRKFIFKEMDDELVIDGYTIDFKDIKNNPEKSESVRVMIEMCLSEVSNKQKTNNMSPREAVIFSIGYLLEHNNQYNGDYLIESTLEDNRHVLQCLASDTVNEHNKGFAFTKASREQLTSFVKSLREDHLDDGNLRAISHFMHNQPEYKLSEYNHDVYDLVSAVEESNKSKEVKAVNMLVSHYEADLSPMETLLKIAKKFDDYTISLLEKKLKSSGIDIDEFQKDLKTKNKPATKYPF
ncbi:hypothetical protein [Pseudomonas putida]|uniref:hypothetical protein n=1 Tax=Pseudomonas putida TaxID=303 RepID=UPI0037C583A8